MMDQPDKKRMPVWGKVVITCVSIICVAFIAFLGLGTWAMANGYGEADQSKKDVDTTAQQVQPAAVLDKTIQLGSVSMKYPSSWEIITSNDKEFQAVSKDGSASVFIQRIEKKSPDEKWFAEFAQGVSENSRNIRDYSLDGYPGKRFDCEMDVNGIAYDSDCIVVATKDEVVGCISGAKDTSSEATLSDMAASLRVVESDASKQQEAVVPKTKTPAPKVETPAPAVSAETAGQKNAVKKAKDYLSYTAFSYTGLIGQLEYEKFSTEDATYGADHCGADWNKQAAKKAKDYLDYTSFSREGLIEQLLYEGFTEDQSIYGVDSVGL